MYFYGRLENMFNKGEYMCRPVKDIGCGLALRQLILDLQNDLQI